MYLRLKTVNSIIGSFAPSFKHPDSSEMEFPLVGAQGQQAALPLQQVEKNNLAKIITPNWTQ